MSAPCLFQVSSHVVGAASGRNDPNLHGCRKSWGDLKILFGMLIGFMVFLQYMQLGHCDLNISF